MPYTTPSTMLIDRTLIRLTGEDVGEFLQGLVTNDITGNMPVWAALLTPQGKVLFDFLIWADEEDFLIDCERDAADALAKRLTQYRLRRAISIEREADLAVHWAPVGDLGVVDPRLPELGQRWLAPASGEAGADDAWRAHRLSLGVTEGAAELGSDKMLWLECNAAELHGVSFSKGCYVGQENTARMNWRQKVNRRLVVMPIADADEKRQVTAYPDLGWSVEHRRIDAIDTAKAPGWLREELAASGS